MQEEVDRVAEANGNTPTALLRHVIKKAWPNYVASISNTTPPDQGGQ